MKRTKKSRFPSSEYTFSFFVDDSERVAFIADFGTFLKRAKDGIVIGDEPIWVNGQADLVVKNKDGSIKVYDYKSDAMNGKAATAFAKSIQNVDSALYKAKNTGRNKVVVV